MTLPAGGPPLPAFRLLDGLLDMQQMATDTRVFLQGMDRDAFMADRVMQRAILWNLEVIGEAVARLSRDHAAFLAAHPAVPWRAMKGMRDTLIHAYHRIDLDVVWDTATRHVPELLETLATLIEEVRATSAPSPGG